jgi:hypothetical protein
MSTPPKKPTLNLYGYEVINIPNRPVVDPNLDGKPEEKKSNGKMTELQLGLIIIGSLIYAAFAYIAAFHSFRAYGTNELYDKIPRVVIATIFAPFYLLYVVIKTNVHGMFGLEKGKDLIAMTGKPYYLHM